MQGTYAKTFSLFYYGGISTYCVCLWWWKNHLPWLHNRPFSGKSTFSGGNSTFSSGNATSWFVLTTVSFRKTESLHMIDFNCMQCVYGIARAYCLFLLEFLIVQKYFFLFLSRLHSNSFCLLITNGFDDVPLVVVILLDDNSGTHCTGRKLLSWTFISSVHSSSLISLNVVLNLDRKLV